MKDRKNALLVLLAAAAALLLRVLPPLGAAEPDKLAADFLSPASPSAKPLVWWHWMDGNITKEGITADLESMKRVGIGGATILDVTYSVPQGPIKTLSPEWYDMVAHAMREAERLGLQIGMHNCIGYSSSGGPWVPPEHAMQNVVASKMELRGPARFSDVLPMPPTHLGFFRDIAVLAFPTPPADIVKMSALAPKITSSADGFDAGRITDGDINTSAQLPIPTKDQPQWIQFEFAEPRVARTAAISTGGWQFGTGGEVQISNDGAVFRKVKEFQISPAGSRTVFVAMDPPPSRFYRILFNSFNNHLAPRDTTTPLPIGEVDLRGGLMIEDFLGKADYSRGFRPSSGSAVSKDVAVDKSAIRDVSAHMDQSGRLDWEVPPGDWTILRIGHTPTEAVNHPASAEGKGPECDKLSREAFRQFWGGLMAKVVAQAGPLAGKAFTHILVDSYEVGSQNWTPGFREEFQKRCGYDLLPYLPALTGKYVGSAEETERFLWDFRRVIAQMFAENYYDAMAELAHEAGLLLAVEPYGNGPFDELLSARNADVPMGEFWVPDLPGRGLKSIASISHVYGKRLTGAEAFTATTKNSRWQQSPEQLKGIGDDAYISGINQFSFHRFAHQPWLDRAPGMTMGPWGSNLERTSTWWEQGKAWITYLTRCQNLLQKGLFVADVLFLSAEGSPAGASVPAIPGYDADVCNADALLNRVSVKDGRLTLPDGMSYRVLVLPNVTEMTPGLLKRIKELAAAGATIIGPKPVKSPSLSGYPQCDDEVRRLANELWDSGKITDRPAQKVLGELRVPPDFSCEKSAASGATEFNSIHRRAEGAEIYFVANPAAAGATQRCTFRVEGRQPELWDPASGRIVRTALYSEGKGTTTLPLHLDPSGSVFVVFRSPAAPAGDRVVAVSRDGDPVPGLQSADSEQAGDVSANFTMDFWVLPEAETGLPPETDSGVANAICNNAIFPAPGHEIYGMKNTCSGVSVGTNGVCVYEHGVGLLAPTLVYPAPLNKWTHVVVVYHDGVPTLYLDGRRVRDGLKTDRIVHSSWNVRHDRHVEPFKGKLRGVRVLDQALDDAGVAALDAALPSDESAPPIELLCGPNGAIAADVTVSGNYTLDMADGRKRGFQVTPLPAPAEITGPWRLQFPAGRGAPPDVTLEKLISWTDSPDPGVKYFSGTATYTKTFDAPPDMLKPGRRCLLDLGKVGVLAEVKLNGKDLGILWKQPFATDITDALRPGENALEVRVTNLWVNRLIGDEQLPPDVEWKEVSWEPFGKALKEWPQWLLDNKPSPTGRIAFTTWHTWNKDDPLLPSGLIGPVTLHPSASVSIPPTKR